MKSFRLPSPYPARPPFLFPFFRRRSIETSEKRVPPVLRVDEKDVFIETN
jgi:hypothetical protein